MKRFFRFFAIAIVAMAVAGCNDTNDEELGLDTGANISEFQQKIDKYSDYDVNSVAEMLCGKEWEMWSCARYDKDWNFDHFTVYKGETDYVGVVFDSYIFNSDYTFTNSHGGYCRGVDGAHDESGTWEFNPETRELTMTTTAIVHEKVYLSEENHREGDVCDNERCKEAISSTRKIISLGNDLLVWDFGFELVDIFDGGTECYNYRYEYIVEK